MQYFFARALLIILLTLNPLSSVFAQPNSTASTEISHWNKLLNGEEVFIEFQSSVSKRARVIVNLVAPDTLKEPAHWQTAESRKLRRKSISALQEPLLGKMNRPEMQLRHRFENQAGFSAEVTLDALEELLKNPRVESVEPVRVLEAHLAQGIPLINGMTYRSTYTGAGVSIAICDSGIDYLHPKLGGAEFPNSKVIGGYDFGDGNSDPYPAGVAHGTACAGIAAGNLGTYGDYIGGVAPGAKIYALKITAGTFKDADNDKIIAAWNWCVSHQYDDPENPILVVSTSYGGQRYYANCDGAETAFKQAADNLERAGITLVCSSGNNGYCDSIMAPACLSTAISVGSVYDASIGSYQYCLSSDACVAGTLSSSCPDGMSVNDTTAANKVPLYCNIAPFLTLLAPSDKVFTTDINGSAGYYPGDYVSIFGGTSAACPYAAGSVAALQCAAHSLLGRFLTPSQVRARLTSSGDSITDAKSGITKPRINLGRAIDGFSNVVQLLAPAQSETIAKGITPQFSWLQNRPVSQWFYLYLQRGNTKYMDVWVPADTASTTNTCALSAPLPGGSYTWWIHPWSVSGYGDWSLAGHFTVESCIPDKPTAVAPLSTTEGGASITYSWSADPCVLWHDLYIMTNGVLFMEKWIQSAGLTSSDGLVSCAIDGHKNGAYSWRVRGWSTDGLGSWSDVCNFSVSNLPPGAVTLLSPAEADTLTNLLAPDFVWSEPTPAAVWYYVTLYRDGNLFAAKWVQAANRCALANYLPPGNYSWRVQPWSPAGLGPWSTTNHFTVPQRLPAPVQTVSPTGAASAGAIDYTWVNDANATWYELCIYTNAKPFLDKWYSTNDLAAPSPGQVSAHVTQLHGSGVYSWWVRGWGPDGMGQWSCTSTFSVP